MGGGRGREKKTLKLVMEAHFGKAPQHPQGPRELDAVTQV